MATTFLFGKGGEAIGRAIGVARTAREIARLLAIRRNELGITSRQIDQIAGLADGHTSKIECGTKNLGLISLSVLLETLGLKMVIIVDSDLPPQTRRALGSKRTSKHKPSSHRFGPPHQPTG